LLSFPTRRSSDLVDEFATLVNEVFEQRLTESKDCGAFVLGVTLQWMNHFASVGERHVAQNLALAVFAIDFHFGSAQANFPERRGITERHIFVLADFEVAAPPDLSFGIAKVALHDF